MEVASADGPITRKASRSRMSSTSSTGSTGTASSKKKSHKKGESTTSKKKKRIVSFVIITLSVIIIVNFCLATKFSSLNTYFKVSTDSSDDDDPEFRMH